MSFFVTAVRSRSVSFRRVSRLGFPDMINRSVPGYATVVGMTGTLAAQHARPGSKIYDLGCSWGASLLSVAREATCEDCQLVGVDNSAAMISQASAH